MINEDSKYYARSSFYWQGPTAFDRIDIANVIGVIRIAKTGNYRML